MSLFHKVRDLLQPVKAILFMVQHDLIENLSQVSVEVVLSRCSDVLGFFQLFFYALESIQTDAHL